MQLLVKRIFDVFVALLSMVLLFPLWLIIIVAIKLSSSGPIFYMHKRVGKGNKEFICFKFRTMYIGADPHKLADSSKDERITKVGRVLRELSLDETPQLINVLLGHMSIVGPRPAIPSQVAKFSKKNFDKLLVKPGLTGWTQINGRNAVSYEKRMELDCWYARNWSLFLDFKIILKTPFILFKQEGIYNAK